MLTYLTNFGYFRIQIGISVQSTKLINLFIFLYNGMDRILVFFFGLGLGRDFGLR